MGESFDEISRRAVEIQNVADDASNRFDSVATFQEAAYLKSDIQALLNLLEQYRIDLLLYRKEQEKALERAENTYYSLSVFKRALSSRNEEKAIKEIIENIDGGLRSVDTAASDLSNLTVLIPINKAEQKAMLQDLKQTKSELLTEKKAVNENMRQVRTAARQSTVPVTGVRGGAAKYYRAGIRMSKEGQLAPHEDAKATIEAQIIDVERQINRLSLFGGDDFSNLPPVYRCAYCGRRVLTYDICPGCGSTQIKQET